VKQVATAVSFNSNFRCENEPFYTRFFRHSPFVWVFWLVTNLISLSHCFIIGWDWTASNCLISYLYHGSLLLMSRFSWLTLGSGDQVERSHWLKLLWILFDCIRDYCTFPCLTFVQKCLFLVLASVQQLLVSGLACCIITTVPGLACCTAVTCFRQNLPVTYRIWIQTRTAI